MPDEGGDHEQELMKEDIPREVLDYCPLHEIASITVDFGMDVIERRREVAGILAECPGKEIAKKWFDQVMMEI